MILCFPPLLPQEEVNSGTAFRFSHFRDYRLTGETSTRLPVTVHVPHLVLTTPPLTLIGRSLSFSQFGFLTASGIHQTRCYLCLCSSCSLCRNALPSVLQFLPAVWRLLKFPSLQSLQPSVTLRYLNFYWTQCWPQKSAPNSGIY